MKVFRKIGLIILACVILVENLNIATVTYGASINERITIPITSDFYNCAIYLDWYNLYDSSRQLDSNITELEFSEALHAFSIINERVSDKDVHLTYKKLVEYIVNYLESTSDFNLNTYKKYVFKQGDDYDTLHSIGILPFSKDIYIKDGPVTYQEAMQVLVSAIRLSAADLMDMLNTRGNNKLEKEITPYKFNDYGNVDQNQITKAEGENVTIKELCEAIKDVTDTNQRTDFKEYSELATYGDLLTVIYGYSTKYKVFTIDYGFNIKYSLQDSEFMSSEEFNFYSSHADDILDAATLENAVNRLKDIKQSLRLNFLNTVENTKDFLFTYYPNIENMLRGYESVIDYWIRGFNPINVTYIKKHDDVSTSVHESQHEISALKSKIFYGHRMIGDWCYVDYTHKPNTYYWYSPLSEDWLEFDTSDLKLNFPTSRNLIDSRTNLSEEIKESVLYKNYIISSSMSSNTWGLPGILYEVSSTAVDNHVTYMCYSLNNLNKVTDTETATADAMFWVGCLYEYLCACSERYPEKYETIMGNPDIVEACYELTYYMFDDMENSSEPTSYEYSVYIDWVNSERIQEQIVNMLDKHRENLNEQVINIEDVQEISSNVCCGNNSN